MTFSSLNHIARQEKTRREILHKSDLVPPLPDLVARLLHLLGNQQTEPEDLEHLLQNDQVLVGKMLALVNSPFYGLNRTIRTIKEAVMVLGFRGVRSLVLAAGTAKFLQRDFSWYGHDAKGLWLHAVCVASAARRLAARVGMGDEESEQLFVGGLLHDIGKLLLVSYLRGEPAAGAGDSIESLEREAVGLDHAEAGSLVVEKWNLAPEVQQVVGAHHGSALEPVDPRAVAVVRLADAVAHERKVGYLPGRAPLEPARFEDMAALGLSDAEWAAVRDELAATIEEASVAMGDLGG